MLRSNPLQATSRRPQSADSMGAATIGFTMREFFHNCAMKILPPLPVVLRLSLLLVYCACCLSLLRAQDLEAVVKGLQNRYASFETMTGNFHQTYRGPGIDQVESGVFWLKKPGFMRWESHDPEEKLFVADGRTSYHYIPQDYQVYIQPLTTSDLLNTPLELLLDAGNISKSYAVSWEVDLPPQFDDSYVIRLKPRKKDQPYSYLVLEFGQDSWDLRRILAREANGNTNEFLLTNVTMNIKIEKSKFQFKTPRGVEEIQISNEE